jgi:hypothetical protein
MPETFVAMGRKLAANLQRLLRLHVVSVEVRRTAGQPDENDCVILRRQTRFLGLRAELKEIAQAQAEHAQRTGFEKATPRDRAAAAGEVGRAPGISANAAGHTEGRARRFHLGRG